MLPEHLRQKCEELADAVAEEFGYDDDERDETYDGLLKVASGEVVV